MPEPADPNTETDDKKVVDAEYAARLRREKAASDARAAAAEKERDELKAWREKQEADQLAEEKKWQELAAKNAKRAEEAEKRAEEATRVSDQRFIFSEAKVAAVKAGIVDVDDVRSLDLSALKIGADGQVEGLDDFMKSAQEKKPHWFKPPEASPVDGNSPDRRAFDRTPATPPARANASKDGTRPDAFKMSEAEFAAALAQAKMPTA